MPTILPNFCMKPLTVALDVRLISRAHTGDTSYWRGLLQGFCEIEDSPRLLLYSNAPQPESVPMPSGAEWVHLPGESDRIWSAKLFPEAALSRGVDLIHTQYNLSPLYGKKGVTTIHDVSFFVNPAWYGFKDRTLLKLLIPRTVKQARGILTVSETSRQEIEQFLPAAKGKVRVTPNAPAPFVQRLPKKEAQARVREEFGLTPPYVVVINSAWARKNVPFALQVSRELHKIWPHTLAICGKGNLVDAPSHAKPLGYVEDSLMSAHYSGADLLLLPSLHEGFGIPIVEAGLCHCPVAAFDRGAMKEVGGSALIAQTSDHPEAWAKSILAALQDSGTLERLQREGASRAAQYSWKRTAELTLAAYREWTQ
ncbi:MAG: glycosyltransferase family 4 protein [Armatimonadetes bacterium]|nr:glycosyltransferase family 4 protein [Armatimonadota bacterium]